MVVANKVLSDVYRKRNRAQDRWYEAIEAELVPGTAVTWMHGAHRQDGVVLRTARGYVFLKNNTTGREVRLYAERLESVITDYDE